VAIVQNAGMPNQHSLQTVMADLPHQVAESPALVIVGSVAAVDAAPSNSSELSPDHPEELSKIQESVFE
jgi:siroheme synthase